MNSHRRFLDHSALIFALQVSLMLIWGCESPPLSQAESITAAEAQEQESRGGAVEITPRWKLGERVDEDVLAKAKKLPVLAPPSSTWNRAESLRVVEGSALDGGLVRVFFDRPVSAESVRVEFDTPHELEWLGEQLLVIRPETEPPEGMHEVKITAAVATDETALVEPWRLRFRHEVRTSEEGEERVVASEVSETTTEDEDRRLIYLEPDSDRFVRTKRPTFVFYSNEKLDPGALKDGVVFAQRKRVFGERTLIPVPARTRYVGVRKARAGASGRVHVYEAAPTRDLEVGLGSYFHVDSKLKAPEYGLSEHHWMTHYFGVVERDLTFAFSQQETAIYVTTTHPIAPSALASCFDISPKPRVYDVSLRDKMRLLNPRYGSWTYLIDVLPAMPGMTYKVRVKSSCRSEFGTTPRGKLTHTFELSDDTSAYMRDGVLEPRAVHSSVWMPRRVKPALVESEQLAKAPYFPVLTRRAGDGEVDLYKLSLEQLVASMHEKKCVSKDLLTTFSLEKSDDPLEIKRQNLDLRRGVNARYHGAFCIDDSRSKTSSSRRKFSGATLVSTDLAVTRRGSLFWVTRLSDGAPVPGASVKAWSKAPSVITSGETDALGVVALDEVVQRRLDGAVITAELEGDITILEPSSDPASYHNSRRYEQWVAHVMTDRGVYRPGDRVHLSGWLRKQASSMELPGVTELEVQLRDAAGGQRSCSAVVSPLGGWGCEIALADDAPAGEYGVTLEFSAPDSTGRSLRRVRDLSSSIRVARYEPPRFALEASHRREKGDVLAEVFRYAGAPIPGAAIDYKITTQPIAWSSEAYDGFVFGEDGEERLLSEGSGESDDKGRFSVSVPAREVRIPTRFRAELTAEDIDGEVVTRRLSWVALPRRIVGLRVEQGQYWFGSKHRGRFRTQVVALTRGGAREGSGAVNLILHKEERHPSYKLGADGRWIRTYATTSEEVARCSTRSRKTTAGHCDFEVEDGGTYVVELRAGKTLLAKQSVYISRGSRGHTARPGEVEVLAKWPHVEHGAVAEVLLNSPYTREARALVTLETGEDLDLPTKILWKEVIELTSSSTAIEIPIPDDLPPQSVVVTAVVVRGRVSLSKGDPASWSPYDRYADMFWSSRMHWKGSYTSRKVWDEGFDPGRPLARSASTRFRVVEPAGASASLELMQSHEEVRPGEPVQVSLMLKDASGKPHEGEAVVMVVDEGALAVSNHNLSLPAFRGGLDYFVATSVFDARSFLTTPDEMGMKSSPGGGGVSPGFGGDAFRIEDALTAHVERIELDEDGKGEVRFIAPERLSNYRVMALATHGVTRRTFASARSGLVVSKTIQVRPSLPRFVSQGDTFTVRAMILSEVDGPVNVTLGALGGVALVDPAASMVSLDVKKGEPQWARWEVRVSGEELDASFVFHAAGEKALSEEQDRVRVDLPVRFKTASSSVNLDTWQRALLDDPGWRTSQKGLIGEEGVRVSLDTTRMKIDHRSRLTINASASSDHVIEEFVDGLVAYPHGCGEQTSSKLHGVLVSREYARLHPEWSHDVEELDLKAAVGIKRLLGLLTAEGGLSLWPSRSTNTWVTLYGTWTLLHAREAGMEVPERALERLLGYIENAQSRGRFENLQERAFAAWVLAMGGKVSRVKLELLYDERDKMTRVSAALTAMAFAEVGSTERAEAMLEVALEEWRTLSRHETYYSSERRELAILLLAAVKIKPGVPVLTKLFSQVLAASGDATQSRAFAALALFEATKVRDWEEDVISVIIAGQVFAQQQIGEKTWSMTIPLKTLTEQGESVIYLRSASGLSRVLYEIEVDTPLIDSEPTLWRELQVARVFIHASGPKAGQVVRSPLRVGDLVVVHHLVDCRVGLSSLAITDPLPAGLERVQTSFDTTSSRERELASEPSKVHPALARWGTSDASIHQESLTVGEGLYPRSCYGTVSASYLARAMTPGTFQAPAVHAERMYARAFYARSSPDEALVIQE